MTVHSSVTSAKEIASHIGGHLALDFCNTAGWHLSAQPSERFKDWECFARWCLQMSLIHKSLYPALVAKSCPIEEVIALRETIFRIGLAAAKSEAAVPRDFELLRKIAQGEMPSVKATGERLFWAPMPAKASAQLRAVLAQAALGLFCSADATRIRLCEGAPCGWLFIDNSRNKRRRWCSMDDCGARAKARRFYASHAERRQP